MRDDSWKHSPKNRMFGVRSNFLLAHSRGDLDLGTVLAGFEALGGTHGMSYDKDMNVALWLVNGTAPPDQRAQLTKSARAKHKEAVEMVIWVLEVDGETPFIRFDLNQVRLGAIEFGKDDSSIVRLELTVGSIEKSRVGKG